MPDLKWCLTRGAFSWGIRKGMLMKVRDVFSLSAPSPRGALARKELARWRVGVGTVLCPHLGSAQEDREYTGRVSAYAAHTRQRVVPAHLLDLCCVVSVFEKRSKGATWRPVTVLWLQRLAEESSGCWKGWPLGIKVIVTRRIFF